MFNFSDSNVRIVQAPMAGGINNPRFASEVANAGGVGSFGFAYSTPQKIHEDLVATRALTNGIINANFFIFSPIEIPKQSVQSQAIEALRNLRIDDDHPKSLPTPPFYPNLKEQLNPVWENRPEILTFHFGIPSQDIIEKAHSLGIAVGITATSPEEAKAIEKAGADFIIAQGIEAGGHRGIFDTNAVDKELTVIELTKRLAKECAIPIVAAGAIMDGADIGNALNVGATAAQLGTAFLCCDESGASTAHKDYLLNKHSRSSVFTIGFSGRPARGIDNEFIRIMEGKTVLPFPMQNSLTAQLRQLATKANDGEFQSLWAGKDFARVRKLKTKDLMTKLNQELLASLD